MVNQILGRKTGTRPVTFHSTSVTFSLINLLLCGPVAFSDNFFERFNFWLLDIHFSGLHQYDGEGILRP